MDRPRFWQRPIPAAFALGMTRRLYLIGAVLIGCTASGLYGPVWINPGAGA